VIGLSLTDGPRCRECGLLLLDHERAAGVCADCELRAWEMTAPEARGAVRPPERFATHGRHATTTFALSGVFKRVSGRIKRGLGVACRWISRRGR
jgi:hypothetical protein